MSLFSFGLIAASATAAVVIDGSMTDILLEIGFNGRETSLVLQLAPIEIAARGSGADPWLSFFCFFVLFMVKNGLGISRPWHRFGALLRTVSGFLAHSESFMAGKQGRFAWNHALIQSVFPSDWNSWENCLSAWMWKGRGRGGVRNDGKPWSRDVTQPTNRRAKQKNAVSQHNYNSKKIHDETQKGTWQRKKMIKEWL